MQFRIRTLGSPKVIAAVAAIAAATTGACEAFSGSDPSTDGGTDRAPGYLGPACNLDEGAFPPENRITVDFEDGLGAFVQEVGNDGGANLEACGHGAEGTCLHVKTVDTPSSTGRIKIKDKLFGGPVARTRMCAWVHIESDVHRAGPNRYATLFGLTGDKSTRNTYVALGPHPSAGSPDKRPWTLTGFVGARDGGGGPSNLGSASAVYVGGDGSSGFPDGWYRIELRTQWSGDERVELQFGDASVEESVRGSLSPGPSHGLVFAGLKVEGSTFVASEMWLDNFSFQWE